MPAGAHAQCGSRPGPLPQDPLPAEAIDRLLVELFPESYAQVSEEVVLDLDMTDLPLHGCQEGRFFHGFYDEYCYLPLYIFCGDQLLGVRLRTADQDASADRNPRAGLRWESSCAPIRVSAAMS